jgi:hypothetical protein
VLLHYVNAESCRLSEFMAGSGYASDSRCKTQRGRRTPSVDILLYPRKLCRTQLDKKIDKPTGSCWQTGWHA